MVDYAQLNRSIHARGDDVFSGRSITPHVDRIADLVKTHRSKSILDYGCGKGHQYSVDQVHDRWGGILPTLYDVGVEEFAKKPKCRFDGVICTDVMEHIAVEDVSAVAKEVFRYARHWVFFSISTRDAKKVHEDGTNVHLTVKPGDWWLHKLEKAAKGRPFCAVFV